MKYDMRIHIGTFCVPVSQEGWRRRESESAFNRPKATP